MQAGQLGVSALLWQLLFGLLVLLPRTCCASSSVVSGTPWKAASCAAAPLTGTAVTPCTAAAQMQAQ